MLKLTLKPGEYLDIGKDIRVIFSGGSANNIHLLIDAPRSYGIARNKLDDTGKKAKYYKEKPISEQAKKEITEILMREKRSNVPVQKENVFTVNHSR